MKALHVTGWNKRHENSASRQVGKLSWRAEPIEVISQRRDLVLEEPDGYAIWGVFSRLKDLANNAPKHLRGYLVTDDCQPLSLKTIARILGTTLEFITRVVEVLSREETGFMETCEIAVTQEELEASMPDLPLWQGQQATDSSEQADTPPSDCHQHADGTPMACHQRASGVLTATVPYQTGQDLILHNPTGQPVVFSSAQDRSEPVISPRLQRAETGTGASAPRELNRNGTERLKRRGPEREAELINRLGQVKSVGAFELAFDDVAKLFANRCIDADNERDLAAVRRRIRDHPRRAELAGKILFKLITTLEWVQRGHQGNAWAIWRSAVNKLLQEAKVA